MTFAILGPLEIRRRGKAVEITGQRLRTLLGLLLLDAGRVVSIDRLVDGVWEDCPPNAVGNALQALISRLRTVLADQRGLVEAGAAGYRLAVDPDRVDAHRFVRLAAEGREFLMAGAPGDAAAALHAALALWRGPALAGLPGNHSVTAAVARLDTLRLAAVEDRVEAELLLGRQTEVAAELPALIAAHPLRERFRGQLMRALYGSGRHVEALASYEDARAAFADELGADPSPELAALHLSMLRHEWAENGLRFPPAGESGSPAGGGGPPHPPPVESAAPLAAPRRGNLPARITSFVGRERDVTRTTELLAGHRLVTLLGPGGAGKTRLSIESAEAVAGRMPDGVWLVELAPVAEPSQVPQAVFSALELRDPSPVASPAAAIAVPAARDPLARLVSGLAGKRLLIVLDNCEHVVEAAAALADQVLAACPGVRVLATSREPLGITGEMTWPVPPLDLPPGDGDPGEALGYPAVRLFTERAAAVRPGYRPEAEAAAVVRICRELDGMPLAIELAAARLRSLSAEQIAHRLDDRFRLLTGGSRTALPRHQTLRAVVGWSWDLLDEQERTLARRLSAFAGGAALDCAEAICSGQGLARADVLDVLARLVDKSLVVAHSHDAVVRYRMLETIRAYAAERLAEAGEHDRVRLAHAVFFTELAETSDPGLRGAGQLAAVAAMAAEHDNLSAALRWTVETARFDLALRMVGALGWYWWLRGYRIEGARRAREVLGLVGDGADLASLVLARASYGANAAGAGIELDRARAELAEVVRLAREGLPRPWHPLVVMAGPIIALFTGVFTGGDHYLDEMLAHPDPWVIASARLFEGYGHFFAGRIAEGRTELAAALRGFREIGDRWGIANVLAELAELDFLHGEPTRALEAVHEAIALMEKIGAVDEVAYMRSRLALGLNLAGDRAAAEEILEDALKEAVRNGDRIAMLNLLSARGDFAREDGGLDEARHYYAEAMRVIDETPGVPLSTQASVNAALGLLAEQEGDLTRGRRLLGVALRQALESAEVAVLGLVLIGSAGLVLSEGDPATAAMLLGGAATVRGIDAVVDFDHVRITERTMAALGREEYSRCYERGRLLSREEIVAVAGRGGEPYSPPSSR
ncbi:putative ATPase/DNA-binding SARP family transcriptional activator [Streptosporangium album]|uniref:Putative ATPase/DNA-binding SARP family transcriptional activator n=1 Tax=Streptosporangium album TaxID=47479 RepID=A0A7W7RQJ1_9ACTN|nr:BTAD domain-containing putative transcriptional regulator [Streptosporangium album]MBB4936052.1 putative ATPase/DNA-binding SARP family transcriptional activator [Streptosporangium album]